MHDMLAASTIRFFCFFWLFPPPAVRSPNSLLLTYFALLHAHVLSYHLGVSYLGRASVA